MKFLDKFLKNDVGFIKENVVLARIGAMDYLGSELDMGLNDDEVYQVHVNEDELFHPDTIASAEGIDSTFQHPDSLEVKLDDWKSLSVGHVQNIYRDGDFLKGTIFIKDKPTIAIIEQQGIKEVSLGYDSDIIEKDGKLIKTNIRANHLAIVPEGRCGSACKIGDYKKVKTEMLKTRKKLSIADTIASLVGGKTSQQKVLAKKFGDAKKTMTSKAKKLGDASESLKQKLVDLEEININPDATAEEKAAASQELQVEVVDTINEAVTALQESIGLVSDVEAEVKDVAVGDATLPEGVSIPEELAGYVAELESEAETAKAQVEEKDIRIKELEDELAAAKGTADTKAAVNDAKTHFPKAKFGDAKTARQAKEAALIYKGGYDASSVKTLTDCAVDSEYSKIKAAVQKTSNDFGKKLIGDSAVVKNRTSQLGGKK